MGVWGAVKVEVGVGEAVGVFEAVAVNLGVLVDLGVLVGRRVFVGLGVFAGFGVLLGLGAASTAAGCPVAKITMHKIQRLILNRNKYVFIAGSLLNYGYDKDSGFLPPLIVNAAMFQI